jgi:hypothetical protein
MSRRYQSAILTASYNGLQVPNAPTIGTATAGAGSASVTFTAPSNVGGSAITSYTVISSPGSITGTGASSPITVSGLTNGTAYTFTVVATNAYGSGPASAASNSVTPQANVIENVFSTYLYTGNSTSQTITNGINLSGKGGLVWFKNRTAGSTGQMVYDTVRGAYNYLQANTTSSQSNGSPDGLSAFTTSGFSVNGSSDYWNLSGNNFVSWSFREQAKFFDVVTYTGTGSVQNISHNLGSTPGCIIIKRTNSTSNWAVYHRGVNGGTSPQNYYILLSTTAPQVSDAYWNNTAPTSSVFTVGGGDIGNVNYTGSTYVAYLFAHNAGGFGASDTDNVVSCGSYAGTSAAGNTITLGYEPQWLMVKNTTENFTDWVVYDNMRGMPVLSTSTNSTRILNPNLPNAEDGGYSVSPTATGFEIITTHPNVNNSGSTYIYVAIRRGPMAVPTLGTTVFSPTTNAGTGSDKTITTNFPVDLTIQSALSAATHVFTDRLRGGLVNVSPRVYSQLTDAETNTSGGRGILFDSNTSVTNLSNYNNGIGDNYIYYGMRRAPGFFDEVCFTDDGTGTQAVKHNLGVTPELQIVKVRSNGQNWPVYITSGTLSLKLNLTDAAASQSLSPTSTQFTAPGYPAGWTVVSYLFASCPGVSKVGSYTGTGALQTVNCAFTTGARFVLIKRTDSTGDWYVWDSARGITAGNDPYLFLNTTAAEVTGTNYVDSTAAGFQVTAAAPAGINAVGGTYIFLAIA